MAVPPGFQASPLGRVKQRCGDVSFPMHTEDDLLPISALQHLLFCERQTALIHVERLWVENRLTAEGRVLHKKADAAKSETRDGVRITRGLPVHSFELGLYGVCDVVQFQPPEFETTGKMSLAKQIERELNRARSRGTEQNEVRAAAPEPRLTRGRRPGSLDDMSDDRPGLRPRVKRDERAFAHWTITPVEYKRGKPKSNDCDRVQLCAQAMCLEEMLNVEIPGGDLFYGKKQRRTAVEFDQELRQTTVETAQRLHELIASRQTPSAEYEKKCDTCSLLEVCLPSGRRRTVDKYMSEMLRT